MLIQKFTLGEKTLSMGLRSSQKFQGYPQPESNVTYCPNQFFDVLLPNYSRGVVRLVAFMIRKTLGWCDAEGNPQETQILVSYSTLIKHAGISRDMIRKSLDEAIEGGFITCVRKGKSKGPHSSSVSALYELRWDESGEYIKDPKKFEGFFAGEGNRTYIPNLFFDHTITSETLSVIRIVGAIIRNTIGFQTKYGFRRQQVQLSFTQLQFRTKIVSRDTLNKAIVKALSNNHIQRIEDGFFDPNAGKLSKSTTYGLKWADNAVFMNIGQKIVPEKKQQDRSENRTGIGQKIVPEKRSENRTDIKIKQINKTSKIKQQQVAASDKKISYKNLLSQGFSKKIALELSKKYSNTIIENQINWLRKRNFNQNKLGLLRKSIEENWPEPEGIESFKNEEDFGFVFASYFYSGRAGNEKSPIAKPSVNDIKSSNEFVERLLEFWPDKNQVEEWGYEFGATVRDKEKFRENSIISCTLALRNYGDAFYIQLKNKRDRILNEEEAKAAEIHLNKYLSNYQMYLKSEEERIKREEPERYNKWFNKFEKRPRFSAEDPEKSRLYTLRDDAGLLDFWEWDAKVNPEPYKEKVLAL